MPFVSKPGTVPVTTWRDDPPDPAAKLLAIDTALDNLRVALGRAGFSRLDATRIDMAAREMITTCARERDRETFCHG